MGDVLLVTADGSIDCQEDPGQQESASSSLHYCEVVSAMHILALGGSLLLKLFSLYEDQSICLMYLLSCSFTCVRVCKPTTSNEADSEVYVVCLEYKGRDIMKPWLQVLTEHYGSRPSHRAKFHWEITPQDLLNQLYECTTLFHNFQAAVIERSGQLYERDITPSDNLKMKKPKNMIAYQFTMVYEMNKLSGTEEVAEKRKTKNSYALC
jgi:cap2 methyltransferase